MFLKRHNLKILLKVTNYNKSCIFFCVEFKSQILFCSTKYVLHKDRRSFVDDVILGVVTEKDVSFFHCFSFINVDKSLGLSFKIEPDPESP